MSARARARPFVRLSVRPPKLHVSSRARHVRVHTISPFFSRANRTSRSVGRVERRRRDENDEAVRVGVAAKTRACRGKKESPTRRRDIVGGDRVGRQRVFLTRSRSRSRVIKLPLVIASLCLFLSLILSLGRSFSSRSRYDSPLHCTLRRS